MNVKVLCDRESATEKVELILGDNEDLCVLVVTRDSEFYVIPADNGKNALEIFNHPFVYATEPEGKFNYELAERIGAWTSEAS